MDKRKLIPSMFHRRLVLLVAVFIAVTLVLSGQIFRLAVVEGGQRLAAAEAKLDRRTYLPTYRGRILDRHNRVLAIDRASYDVAVEYPVITGAWPRTQASEEAIAAFGKTRWNAFSPEQRESAISKRLPAWKAKTDRLWSEICRLGNITPVQLYSRLDDIKAGVQSTAAVVWEQQRIDERIRYGIAENEHYDFQQRPIREQKQAHPILTQVPDEVAFAFQKLAQELPDMIDVQDSRRREYPWLNAEVALSRASLPKQIRANDIINIRVSGVADHLLGSVRDEVWAADIKRRPFLDPQTKKVIDLGGYLPGDAVGSRGVEKVFEDTLRGKRGEINERRDTGIQSRIDPFPGQDLHLTLDIFLQARVQAILSHEFGLTKVQPWQNNTPLPLGTPLNAAAVVLEVETGEILAMVSMPTIAMGEFMTPQQQAIHQPLVNRPVEAVYPPGSIVKPLVLAAAVGENVHGIDSPIACTGHYFENNLTQARCWIYRDRYGMTTHGPLKAEEALARSCNIFFYTLGDRLGMERLCKWYRKFGLGTALDVGLLHQSSITKDGKVQTLSVGESAGEVPDVEGIAKIKAKGELKFSQVIMGIGQGPVSWTPMQAANAYATLARGGITRDATLVLQDPRGARPQRDTDINLSPRLVDAALEGLRGSVMERYGTGYHIVYDDKTDEPIINAVGVQAWAKTGTAQADVVKKLDHSWFVGLVGPRDSNKPMHAIAVIVEKGGSGGRTAGPIANQIIRALQAEGYLPGDATALPASMNGSTSAASVAPTHDAEDED